MGNEIFIQCVEVVLRRITQKMQYGHIIVGVLINITEKVLHVGTPCALPLQLQSGSIIEVKQQAWRSNLVKLGQS